MTEPPVTGGLPAAWTKVAAEYVRHIVPALLPAARSLCHAAGIGTGDRVIDIACGPGTAALVARELGADHVTGIDYAPGMLAEARARGALVGGCTFMEGDATALPVADGAFDVAVSSFGLIFAADPGLAAREMARVLVPGGRFGILAWLQGDTTADYYEAVYRHLPRPKASHDPYDWGAEDRARAWLAPVAPTIGFEPIDVPFEAASPAVAWEILKRSTGRVAVQYTDLPPEARSAMDRDLESWFDQWKRDDGTIHWPRRAYVIHGRVR